MVTGKKFAVFDIDGTLFRWQLFHEVLQELTLGDTFPEADFLEVDNAWKKWRGGEISFSGYEQVVLHTFNKHLPGIPVDAYLQACRQVVDRSGHKVYRYTNKLLQTLQSKGYVTIAISASQQEALDLFTRRYGFDHCVGAVYEQQGNSFTGKTSRQTYGRKHIILNGLIQDHDLTAQDSYGIGDSESDIKMLQMVSNPIAFNPSEKLFAFAKQTGWPVVLERKNIVYTLNNDNGSYVLEEAKPY